MARTPAAQAALLTLGTVSYVPRLRVLIDSFRKHHPHAQVFVCLVDGASYPPAREALDATTFTVENLSLPGGARFLYRYNPSEICWALKPFAAQYVLERYQVPSLAYLDGDISVYGNFWPILQKHWKNASILLTPHLAKFPNAHFELLRVLRDYGSCNAGFFAVKNDARGHEFLEWWQRPCETYAVASPGEGLNGDQIWLDLVCQGGLGVAMVRDPGFNVGFWNLLERPLARNGVGEWTCGGKPLYFFHFSGVDLDRQQYNHSVPWKPPFPTELVREYTDRVALASAPEFNREYGFARYRNGLAIEPWDRSAFRWGWAEEDAAGDPFGWSQSQVWLTRAKALRNRVTLLRRDWSAIQRDTLQWARLWRHRRTEARAGRSISADTTPEGRA